VVKMIAWERRSPLDIRQLGGKGAYNVAMSPFLQNIVFAHVSAYAT
jgi:hypothetical protein